VLVDGVHATKDVLVDGVHAAKDVLVDGTTFRIVHMTWIGWLACTVRFPL
jgi:hypothetical protein